MSPRSRSEGTQARSAVVPECHLFYNRFRSRSAQQWKSGVLVPSKQMNDYYTKSKHRISRFALVPRPGFPASPFYSDFPSSDDGASRGMDELVGRVAWPHIGRWREQFGGHHSSPHLHRIPLPTELAGQNLGCNTFCCEVVQNIFQIFGYCLAQTYDRPIHECLIIVHICLAHHLTTTIFLQFVCVWGCWKLSGRTTILFLLVLKKPLLHCLWYKLISMEWVREQIPREILKGVI